MIRVLFATLYLTIALLFGLQVRSDLGNPISLGIVALIVALAVWHAMRVIRGAEGSPFRKNVGT